MSDANALNTSRKLAIIGCGSSGLIALKSAIDALPGWQIVCYEKGDQITGVWGNPYPGFVSTSTKYTTQFTCFPVRDAAVENDGGQSRAEFFRDGEYGEYLNQFADAFQLRSHIKLGCQVERLQRAASDEGWLLTYRSTGEEGQATSVTEQFDAVVICTGLTAQCKELETKLPTLSPRELNKPDGLAHVTGERIVVFGGGESAVDYATRLARPELNNEVYLSLRTGVRVSPRYHPIRGVPSDFLRNRLMLSIHPVLRNWIGQRFVEARMLHQERFEKWFPAKSKKQAENSKSSHQELKKEWAYRLTKGAKDELFNMFHNKSDDFLDGVADGRIKIVGEPVDDEMIRFYQFQSDEQVDVAPTKILPAVGYKSTLSAISGGTMSLADFYLGCVHVTYPDLFLVGFARPVIGNIPSISEMQANYITGIIGGTVPRPPDIAQEHALAQEANFARYPRLDLEIIYPVEMFPYCDYLARQMKIYPTVKTAGSLREWCRIQLQPATTAHYYFQDQPTHRFFGSAPVYMPSVFVLLLLLLKPLDWGFRIVRRVFRRQAAHLPS
ncbi:NAD(P)/FAD-dependent oxidoreductase [Bremerella volcania]|uniref:NAD(P)-binding domain-containing protein n=1 Tax=Bremerella volcania TaxID=2527984 RepID=UPI0013FCF5A0|nr:NAD(P)-binding domain-containing protein [Bremerella volcania]